MRLFFLGTVLILAVVGPVQAASKGDLLVRRFELTYRQSPESFVQTMTKQISSREGQIAVRVAAAYFGIDQEYATKFIQVAKAISGTFEKRGKSVYGTIRAPKGYTVCRASATLVSMVGDTTLNIWLHRPRLEIVAVVPQRNAGSGGTSAEAILTVLFSRNGARGLPVKCMPNNIYPLLARNGHGAKNVCYDRGAKGKCNPAPPQRSGGGSAVPPCMQCAAH